MLQCDGDIIRGLGFVTLYSAYAEEQVDELLHKLSVLDSSPSAWRRWPVSKKLKHALKLTQKLQTTQLSDLEQNLGWGLALFEKRNGVVHGRIFAGHQDRDTLKAGRQDVPDRPIQPEELYDLANQFMDYRGALLGAVRHRLPRILSERNATARKNDCRSLP
jgi:hypothetical protein